MVPDMTLELTNGHYHEEHYNPRSTYREKKKMPSSDADFDLYRVNIDVSSLYNTDLDDESWKNSHTMYSLQQLVKQRDTLKTAYNEYLDIKASNIVSETKGNLLKPL